MIDTKTITTIQYVLIAATLLAVAVIVATTIGDTGAEEAFSGKASGSGRIAQFSGKAMGSGR